MDIFAASKDGEDDTVRELLRTGLLSLRSVCPKTGFTSLCLAAQGGHDTIVELLVSAAADVNQASHHRSMSALHAHIGGQGIVPIHAAAERGHSVVIQKLIHARADIDRAQQDGWTPLYLALQEGHKSAVALLLRSGADIFAGPPGTEFSAAKSRLRMIRGEFPQMKMLGAASTTEFAAINIAPFVNREQYDDEARIAVAQSWDKVFCTSGFALIEGHGVSEQLIADLRKHTREFFGKRTDYKNCFAKVGVGKTASENADRGGYSGMSYKSGLSLEADPVEGYTFIPKRQPNWTKDEGHPPDLAGTVEEYYREVERVMHTIHRMSAMALGVEENFFDSYYEAPANIIVLSHYPSLEVMNVRDGKLRYRAHSDYSGFTILLQDEEDNQNGRGGLEIDIDGVWVPIMPKKGCFVVNIGDIFETWTNDRWRSTPHRVTSPALSSEMARQSRYSTMLFSGPNLNSIIKPIHTCVDAEHPARYAPIKASDHMLHQWKTASKEATYAPG